MFLSHPLDLAHQLKQITARLLCTPTTLALATLDVAAHPIAQTLIVVDSWRSLHLSGFVMGS